VSLVCFLSTLYSRNSPSSSRSIISSTTYPPEMVNSNSSGGKEDAGRTEHEPYRTVPAVVHFNDNLDIIKIHCIEVIINGFLLDFYLCFRVNVDIAAFAFLDGDAYEIGSRPKNTHHNSPRQLHRNRKFQ